MRKPDFKVMGAIVSAFHVAVPLALNLKGLFSDWPWQIHALIGFGAFVGFVSWKINDLNKNIAALKGRKAKIDVEPKVHYGDKAFLEIHNSGASDEFMTTARVVKGMVEPRVFNMCWQFAPNDASRPIDEGQTQPIKVAEISQRTEKGEDIREAVFKGCIALFQQGEKRIGVGDYQMVENAKLKERYPTMVKEKLVDECEIEITITSTRGLAEPFQRQRFAIAIDHEHGHKLVFTHLPESNTDKEGFQTG
jgi:hypothetical protein